jgi:hypothetical protein
MPCCGKARTQIQGTISSQRPKPAPTVSQAQPYAGQSTYFRYFGQTGLTVNGPVSSRLYRFVANGAPIEVDARDAASLARVPNLRPVRRG